MPIVVEANYLKKLSLSAHASHQYSLTIRTEVDDASQVQAESGRLYALLQSSVDQEIQKPGFLPGNSGNGNGRVHPGNGHSEIWACRRNQRKLILKLITEQKLDMNAVEGLSLDRFGRAVRALGPLEASGLIEELREQCPNGNERLADRCSPLAAVR